jgi:hypothetical protein
VTSDATGAPPAGPEGTPPWRTWPVGARVVVRRRLPADAPQPYTDVLGDLVAVDDDGVTVRTRRAGEVRVPGAEIALGKLVPPAPQRRPRR